MAALLEQINTDIKSAMLAKEADKLEALRAVKSALLLATTEKGADDQLSEETEIKVLKKLVKQRKDAAAIFEQQSREDLAAVELAQAEIIQVYLPEQMAPEEIEAFVSKTINDMNVSSVSDMGKVMGVVVKALSGKADGKEISAIVKKLLN